MHIKCPLESIARTIVPLVHVDVYHPPIVVKFGLSCRPCYSHKLCFFTAMGITSVFTIALLILTVQPYYWTKDGFGHYKIDFVVTNAINNLFSKEQAHKSECPSWFSRELKRLGRIKSYNNRMLKNLMDVCTLNLVIIVQ